MYWLNWAMAGIAEITAVGVYVHRWLPDLPQWITALVALGALLAVNLVSVKLFGELEFWFSVIKVTAIIAFLLVGIGLVVSSTGIAGHPAGPANLVADGGSFFPHGFGITLIVMQAVVFAYAGIELVGIAAGEAKDPAKCMPKAINGVLWRIGVFYVGSVLLLAMLLPSSLYANGVSPFVTVFSNLGVPWVADVLNAIVLTAALSSCNSGLYSTGRVLRSLTDRKEAPAFTGKMSRNHVPYGGVLFTSVIYLGGVVLNYFVPSEAFDIVTAISSLGVVTVWAMILIAQMGLRRKAMRGELVRPSYRMPGAPVTNWVALACLGLIVVMMGFAGGAEQIAFYSIPGIIAVIGLGWWLVSRRQPDPTPALEPVLVDVAR
jgi:L-asparagine permease